MLKDGAACGRRRQSGHYPQMRQLPPVPGILPEGCGHVNQAMIPSNRTAFRIGDWRVAPALDEISRDGVTAKLEPRTMRVLVCLAEHAGEVVSVEQLLDAVWKDVVVTHDSLYQAVAGLRRALGDDPKNPIYIANVQRRGYRLIAPVAPAEHGQIAASPHRESAPHVDAESAQHPEVIATAPRSHDRLAAVQAPVEPGPRLGSPATNGVGRAACRMVSAGNRCDGGRRACAAGRHERVRLLAAWWREGRREPSGDSFAGGATAREPLW